MPADSLRRRCSGGVPHKLGDDVPVRDDHQGSSRARERLDGSDRPSRAVVERLAVRRAWIATSGPLRGAPVPRDRASQRGKGARLDRGHTGGARDRAGRLSRATGGRGRDDFHGLPCEVASQGGRLRSTDRRQRVQLELGEPRGMRTFLRAWAWRTTRTVVALVGGRRTIEARTGGGTTCTKATCSARWHSLQVAVSDSNARSNATGSSRRAASSTATRVGSRSALHAVLDGGANVPLVRSSETTPRASRHAFAPLDSVPRYRA